MRLQAPYIFCLSLIVLIFSGSCSVPSAEQVEIVWEDNQAVSVRIPGNFFQSKFKASSVAVTVGEGGSGRMLGEFELADGVILFTPVVPFTRGLHYVILEAGEIIGSFTIPIDTSSKNPTAEIFPSPDTVPENLLKFYLVFSEPMAEGRSLSYIALTTVDGDTIDNVFLDLKPELWNEEGTKLTLWLNPGRVKRDLIPNQELGPPITSGNSYTLNISPLWKSKAGRSLESARSKWFFVTRRDEETPLPDMWLLKLPGSETKDPILIFFGEPLDYALTKSCLQIIGPSKNVMEGEISLLDEEKGIRFFPAKNWKAGRYMLRAETKLEDLAGNNLLRPFDLDLQKSAAMQETFYMERAFEIR